VTHAKALVTRLFYLKPRGRNPKKGFANNTTIFSAGRYLVKTTAPIFYNLAKPPGPTRSKGQLLVSVVAWMVLLLTRAFGTHSHIMLQ